MKDGYYCKLRNGIFCRVTRDDDHDYLETLKHYDEGSLKGNYTCFGKRQEIILFNGKGAGHGPE